VMKGSPLLEVCVEGKTDIHERVDGDRKWFKRKDP
jgi:hypothetical protein